ncbi:TetR/AcrR family transcriptional regulator [Shimazuella kribbensis]|uniref:TetR/AcrR family transcriptional regulator n=1 Tax=Shimazuella kribbensis TaxID=139808 RepID=UPI00048A7ADA|nr:TetR/AcrR family transcriptional regulator [Shimazuella kribbensis]
MPRSKEQYEQMRFATNNKIITAGLELFSQKGLGATGIQEIATLAGVSTGLMYRHYKTKEDLFSVLVETAVVGMNDIEEILKSEDSPSVVLKQLANTLLDELKRNNQTAQYLVLITHSLLSGEISPQLLEQYDMALFDQMTRLIKRGQSNGELRVGDPYQMTLLFFSTLHGLAMMKLSLKDKFICPSPEMVLAYLIIEE